MPVRTRRLVVSGIPAVCMTMGLLAIGHHLVWWGPEPPRDPHALVLRIRFVKGMASPFDRPVPDVSVYGDGRMLVVTTEDPARRVIREQRLTGPAYRRLYRDARLAGLGASRTLRGEQVPDAGPTVITLLADGEQRVSTVHAGAGGLRAWAIGRFVERLRRPPRDDLAGPPTTYRPSRTAVVAWRSPAGSSGTRAQIRPWPLSPLTAGDREACTVVTGGGAEAATRLAGAAPASVRWRSGRGLYTVLFRPLLPDEADCTAVTP